jgi:hypothetical protein
LKTETIHLAVAAVDDVIRCKAGTRLHLLGFAKADDIGQFADYRAESFDTTSPLIRAFKGARRNYYLRDEQRYMQYFTAIRIPQAFENNTLKRQAKMGRLREEALAKMEAVALDTLRNYSRGDTSIDTALDAVIDYSRPVHWSAKTSDDVLDKRMETLRDNYRRTLEARPWRHCECPVCGSASVEVIIFWGSNRNKRRRIHNVGVFRRHLQDHLAS